jgi:predicted GIY-YIG superfamily endonuclease
MTDVPTMVYVVACGDSVKIGMSTDPNARLKDMKTGMPEAPYIVATRTLSSRALAHQMEKQLHWRFRARRAHGEWFRVPVQEAAKALRYEQFPAGSAAAAGRRIAEMFDRQYEEPTLFR